MCNYVVFIFSSKTVLAPITCTLLHVTSPVSQTIKCISCTCFACTSSLAIWMMSLNFQLLNDFTEPVTKSQHASQLTCSIQKYFHKIIPAVLLPSASGCSLCDLSLPVDVPKKYKRKPGQINHLKKLLQ